MRTHEYQEYDQWGHDRAEIPQDPDDVEYRRLGDDDPDPGPDSCMYYYLPPTKELDFYEIELHTSY